MRYGSLWLRWTLRLVMLAAVIGLPVLQRSIAPAAPWRTRPAQPGGEA